MMTLKNILITSFVIWLVGLAFTMLTCGWLFSWVYTIAPNVWLDGAAMSAPDNLMATSLIGLATSIIFVAVYGFLYNGIPGKGILKGMNYGFILWLTGALSGMMSMPYYMKIATTVVIYWILQALVLNLIRGAIVGAILKKK